MAARGQWIAVSVILAGIAFAVGAALLLTPDIGRVTPGERAPDFRAIDIATGDTVRLDRYAGQVVLLNIWATWCAPCEAEMPSMQRLHEALGDSGLRIVAVSVDQGSRDQVTRWIKERHLTFEVLQDRSGRIERIYQTMAVPESFVIDREGVIIRKSIGAEDWDAPASQQLFRRLLAP